MFIYSSFNQSILKGGSEETVFMSNAYNNQLLEGFNTLRSQTLLCDVTLITGSVRFPVHRALLAACSPYFRDMFTKDTQNGEICLFIYLFIYLFILKNAVESKLIILCTLHRPSYF